MDELSEYLQERYNSEPTDKDSVREAAAESIRKSQSYNLDYFNRHHKPAKVFSVGEYVVVKNVDTTAGVNRIFIPKYRGPYIIRKQLGNDRYEISDVDYYQITQMPYVGIVDASRLRRWLEPKQDRAGNFPDSEGSTSEYEDYEFLDDEFLESQ